MEKIKIKRYNTKRRKQERLKWKLIMVVTILGVMGIGISYVNSITPVQAESYDLTLETSPRGVQQATEVKEMTVKEHVMHLLVDEGGLSFDEAVTGMAIVNCESRWDSYAIGVNKDGSKDLGLWQINEKFHGKKISRAESFDVYASTRYAVGLYKSWGGWDAWSCYKKI